MLCISLWLLHVPHVHSRISWNSHRKKITNILSTNYPSPQIISKRTLASQIYHNNLSWSYHISMIISEAYKILCLLRRTFCSSNNVTTKKRLYISLVRSQLLYGSHIWRPLQLKDIESLQRRATKYVDDSQWLYTSDYM